MSAIPPDIIGSAIQAGLAQREAARALEGERAGQSHAARSQARAVDDAASNVETTDGDTQVFSDAEGAGGQGRAFDGGTPGEDAVDPDEVAATGASEPGRLDVRA